MRWLVAIYRHFRPAEVGPKPILDEDRTVWDQAWRDMPHRRLAAPPRIEVDRSFIRQCGDNQCRGNPRQLNPPEFSERVWRESPM